MENKNQEEVATDPPGTQEGTNLCFVPSIDSNNTYGVTDLEKILKEKTFTRYEVDRLTELLNSRIVDVPSGVEEMEFEMVPSTPIVSYGRHEDSRRSPVEDGVSTQMVSTHVKSANVLDDDIASPAEIGKAYMGSWPPKATPFSMASHSQKIVDNFGQPPFTPPPSSGFVFGSTAPSLAASPFQFGGQQNVVPAPQNPSPFQASGSLDFNASAGWSFLLGAGGGDKANRKYVKVKSKSRKK